uniref:TFIIS N-terminal domain-containing protein n=1 Tax=Colobus angolensis palliatus TaxID=336983 RepID=A0A2K5HQA4_COLAP
MAAGSTTLHAVEKLQVYLTTKTDLKKLEKYLQKLSALPMAGDILAETGIRKTVKRLRKHQHVGDFARDLAAQWKKLVPVDPNTGPERFPKALRGGSSGPGKGLFPENRTVPRSPSNSPEHRRTAHRTPPGPPSREPRAERKRPRMAAADSSPHQTPPSRIAPLPMPEGPEPLRPGSHAHAAQGGPLLGQGCQGQPQGEGLVSHSKGHKSSPNDSKGTSKKLPPVEESQSERLQVARADSAGPKTVPSHAFSELWDPSEAWMQANYDLLSAFEAMTSQEEPEALSAPTFQEEAAFAGHRVNAKMQVYWGSRPACQPQVLTLGQQCIRVLRNNPDTLSDVEGIPYLYLEPILEGWTPDQLYCREKYNHALIQETDELWRIHCLWDFKEEKPQEHESWQELCLRLQDTQEQRLRVLKANIRSARENKPSGRQTKMICFNSVAKTPYDASRRQDKSAAATESENGEIKSAPKPAGSSHAPSSRGSDSGGRDSSSSSHVTPRAKTRKQAAKKVAPLMAKAIRDYKKRFSRR